MGLALSRLFASLFRLSRNVRILMVGLDAAGKTTILYRLKLDELVTTIPTIGFNVETIKRKNIAFTIWDVGGQEKIRPLWRHYYVQTDAIIFVVDSSDGARLEEARMELDRLLGDEELRDAHVLVFANKQDLPQAMTPGKMSARMSLSSRLGRRLWRIQGCCATTGDGLVEGLEWLSQTLKSATAR